MNVELVHWCGDDLDVVNAARVSFDQESEWEHEPNTELGDFRLKDRDARLIHFLARHKHFSPFNHQFVSMRIKAPIFVARQLVKHKFMPWNEVSGRYVTFKPEFYKYTEYRSKAENKKQGSGEALVGEISNQLHEMFEDSNEECFWRYEKALKLGLCEEQARALLPLNLMTQWRWSGTLGAWAAMYVLRADEHAQKESRIVAQMAGDLIRPLFPVAWEALTSAK